MQNSETFPAGAVESGGQIVDRRTRRRERRRDEVFAAAVALFIEQGFENTSMEQIADRGDVARATVFNYFSRKTAFLEEWSRRRRRRAVLAFRGENVDDRPLEWILKRYMIELARLSEETRVETVALMAATVHATDLLAHPILADELGAFVRKAQDAGEVDDDLNSELVGLIIATSYFAVLSKWISEEPAPFDLAAELLAMLDIVLLGILLEPSG